MKKTNKTIKSLFIALVITISCFGPTYAQNASKDNKEAEKEAKKISIENSIRNKRFKFIAQTVVPQRGGIRSLNYSYDLRVSNDTLESYLPYFGRAFAAPVYTGRSPLEFTSTDFDYQLTERKKDGWDINIKSKDHSGERFYLTVFENGTATLQVTSNNLSSITYYGYVKTK